MGDEVGVRKWKRGVEREKVVADSWMSEVGDEGVGVCMERGVERESIMNER